MEDLIQVGQRWASAELHGDVPFLKSILAEDFLGVGPRGFMLTKEQWLQRYESGDLKNESFGWDDIRVRLYGDAAIVTGREMTKNKYRGQDAGGQFRITQVFVKNSGRWLLASIHLSPIVEAPQGRG